MTGLILPHAGAIPRIANDAFIAETAAVIGNVEIGARSSIWYGVVVRGDINSIRIGSNTNIQDGTIVHVNRDRDGDGGAPTAIGSNVTIGHLALVHACTVEDGAFIGMRSVIMDNAIVEAGAMIAGAAVVTPGKVVGAGQLWTGMPARYVRDVSAAEREDYIATTNHYAELATTYLQERRSS